jgi:CxxC motif-containing protein (DUF1111 family)
LAQTAAAPAQAQDPGVRGGPAGAGGALANVNGRGAVSPAEVTFFNNSLDVFAEVDSVSGRVAGEPGVGLGPRFNLNSCAGCHAQPAVGGTSPFVNPQVAVATKDGAQNTVPSFVTANGPVREARFVTNPDGTPDGGVHDLFVITGRTDAPGCHIAQPNFAAALAGNNVIFRIPTPVFGLGLVEITQDTTLEADADNQKAMKSMMGVGGHFNRVSAGFNRSGNDGTITRFGWKAQNKSLLLFAGEAYNVEMGVTNQLFPQERDETPGCVFNPTPEDTSNFTTTPTPGSKPNVPALPDIEAFADFMRMLAPPTPAPDTASTVKGRALFAKVGCAICHTPSLTTGKAIASGSATQPSIALSNQAVHLFSDLLVHHMGSDLADGITQGGAGPDEFRTAPLWGIGQRIFFLHDGRTTDLVKAIEDHRSPGSEANQTIETFNRLSVEQRQDIVNFLRAL